MVCRLRCFRRQKLIGETDWRQGPVAAEKARLEAQVAKLPHGPQKDGLLQKNSQLDTAAHINEWLTSPGLQPPTKPV